MATSFSSLPIVDLSVLSSKSPSTSDLLDLSKQVYDVFATTGFAYLVNAPLTFSHEEVFGLAREFFSLDNETKMSLAKQSFVSTNRNTYRGYFPPQPGQQDNLKEGFEVGPSSSPTQTSPTNHAIRQKFQLAESNVWPREPVFPSGRVRMEKLHSELQALSCNLLSLLAISLNRDPDFFAPYLVDSLSTLRLLHYPPQPTQNPSSASAKACDRDNGTPKLCCTPHTDSGILTLLHQDPTGGLEVRNAAGEWVAAPYLPGSLVVNIGDLLANVSGGRFVATMHRVRASAGQKVDGKSVRPGSEGDKDGVAMGRLSVPFFFEPGENCIVKAVDGGDGVVYGAHVRRKMGTWVEFQEWTPGALDWKADSVGHGNGNVAVAA